MRLSGSLSESPVCLAAAPGDMDFNLERLLRANKKLDAPPLRLLEINPDHALIRRLGNQAASGSAGKDAGFAESARTLLELARISEYGSPADPAGFAASVAKLMEQAG